MLQNRARTSLRRIAPGELERVANVVYIATVAETRANAERGMWWAIGLIALLAAGKVILADTMDPDAFWHLRVADQLLTEGIKPIVDTISFASIKEPWTPYSWLGELFMHAVWQLGGHTLASLITALCSAGIVLFIARACRARTNNLVAVIICTLVGAYFTLPFISFRPVTFALLLMAILFERLARP